MAQAPASEKERGGGERNRKRERKRVKKSQTRREPEKTELLFRLPKLLGRVAASRAICLGALPFASPSV